MDQRHALIFNAISEGLSAADRFVPLSAREAIARRVAAALDTQPGASPAPRLEDLPELLDVAHEARIKAHTEGRSEVRAIIDALRPVIARQTREQAADEMRHARGWTSSWDHELAVCTVRGGVPASAHVKPEEPR
jgi:hypothetical protein